MNNTYTFFEMNVGAHVPAINHLAVFFSIFLGFRSLGSWRHCRARARASKSGWTLRRTRSTLPLSRPPSGKGKGAGKSMGEGKEDGGTGKSKSKGKGEGWCVFWELGGGGRRMPPMLW